MAMEDRFNRLELPVSNPTQLSFTLNPRLKMLWASVILNVTVVISGGTTNGTPVGDGGCTNLIKRILILANKAAGSRYPNGALVDCSAQSLLRFAMTQRSGKFVSELSGNVLGNGAAGTYNIYLEIPIYFALKNSLGGYGTALNLDAADSQGNPIYSAVQVKIDFATTLAQMFIGNDRAMTINGTLQWADERLDIPSDTIPIRQEDHELFITAQTERLVDTAMPPDGAFTQWLILAQLGGPEWAQSDALLNRIEAEGTELLLKEYWQDNRIAMMNSGFFDPSQVLTGIFFYDWTHGRTLANSNAAAGLLHRFSVNNPSGAYLDRLRIYTRRAFGLGA